MSFTKFLSMLTSSNMELKGTNVDRDNSVVGESQRKEHGNNNNDKDTSANGSGVSGSKVVSGRRRFGENGFEEQGGYMAAKKAKLDNQFNTSTRVLEADGDGNSHSDNVQTIFKGISVYINGYTNPPEPELRELFIRYGGTFHPYQSQTNTTYVIATNLSVPSKRLYGSKTVKPNWIMDSIAAGRALDTRDYKLYNLNEEKKQASLSQFVRPKESSVSKTQSTNVEVDGQGEVSSTTSTSLDNGNHGEHSNEKGHSSDEEEFFECSQEGGSFSPKKLNERQSTLNSSVDESEAISSGEKGEVATAMTDSEKSGTNNATSAVSTTTSTSPNKTGKIKTATDEGFIEDFFGRSRLHLISEQKKEMQVFISNLRKDPNAFVFPNLKKFQAEIEAKNQDFNVNNSIADAQAILMHIDLDCFFVSVGLLSRPHLRGKPVVVTHSTGKTQESRSDIACASYEARKFGVRNGMWVGEAKEKCPSLEVIPYDFEEYRRISKRFFEAVATFTLDIEPNSVDEMVVDVTSILKSVSGATPEDLAVVIRKVIYEETQCPASVGIGSNKLLAKLAVKLAKPDGVHNLKDCDAPSYIQTLHVRDLPGVGWSNEGKLRETFNVETCADLLNVPLKSLKSIFGEKTAEKMHSLCKGIDTTEVKIGIDRPKSVSVDVNFGIRFQKDEDVTNFLVGICKELSSRAEKIGAASNNFTLKLLIRKKGSGEPLKQGGHGIVDALTRSRKLINPTRNWQELYRNACSIIRATRIPPAEYRGVGVTLSDLTFDCDKPNRKSVQRTLTDMPVSYRAQKMLSLTQKKTKGPSKPNSESNISDGALKSLATDATNVDDNIASNSASSTDATITIPNDNLETNRSAQDVNHVGKTVTLEQPSTSSASHGVDINVLRQLPRDIAEEQCQIYGIDIKLLDNEELKTDQSNENSGSLQSIENTLESNGNEQMDEDVPADVPGTSGQNGAMGKTSESVKTITINLDDEQPCSSKQALERRKNMEQQRRQVQFSDPQSTKLPENGSPKTKVCLNENETSKSNGEKDVDMEKKVTPIITYPSTKRGKPVKIPLKIPTNFWDDTVDAIILPSKKITVPALNCKTDISEVRNLIRDGLEKVTDPTPDDVLNLEKYFKELISNCWLQQVAVLLRFLNRQIPKLPQDSKWRPNLIKIIEDSQKLCKKLYYGAINLEG